MWSVGDSIRQGEVHGTVTAVNGTFSVYYHLENGTCGECLPHRLEEGYRMSRPRSSPAEKKAKAEAKQTNGLLEAVRFCAPGYKENGETYSTHAMIWQGWITTYNGIVMFGHKIETDMQAMPHFGKLYAALKTTDGTGVQLTLTDQARLSVKGKGFRTVVPCLTDHTLVSRTAPDTPVGMIDSRMREGFEVMRKIASKTGEHVMESAILLRNGDMISCDRKMLGMYWHGLGFPELVVPADFIEAVLKVPKPLVSFGFTPDQSLTFYFDDNSFIRTQLYADKYPDVSKAIPEHFEGLPQLPDEFWNALAKIEPFLDKEKHQKHCWVNNNSFSTDEDDSVGTVTDCPGLQEGPSGLDVARALRLRDHVTHFDYAHATQARFQGPNFRGVLCQFALVGREEAPDRPALPSPSHDYGSDVTQSAADTFHHPEEHAPYLGTAPVDTHDGGGDPYDMPPVAFAPPQPVSVEDDEPVIEPAASGWAVPGQ